MSGLFVFVLCAVLLWAGYLFYGRFAEKVYGSSGPKVMPCVAHPDGVDYMPLPAWKVFLIQLLNIAGLGPVFGALAGALFGPAALLWIVFGCIFAGAMHDFLSALMSLEHRGANLPELIGRYLGPVAHWAMRLVCIVLLLLVGVVFTKGPAGMLHGLMPDLSVTFWCGIILLYYFLATVLPIDAIIGRVYPIFGALFLFMAVGLLVTLPFGEHEVLPQTDFFTNMHPQAGLSIWPMIFVTIACGAISGFHATQSPLMVRCLKERRNMRRVFYGAMIVEGLVALVWATVGLTLRDVLTDYTIVEQGGKVAAHAIESGSGAVAASFMQLCLADPASAVNQACTDYLGSFGAVLAVIGVVVLPITSGDTAMRCCRLMLADVVHLDQGPRLKRFALAIPLFAAVIFISEIDFTVIWRYFGWSNQMLSCFTLWTIAVLLRRRARWYWMALLPAVFMTTVCTAYLLSAPECAIGLSVETSTLAGLGVSLLALIAFFRVPRGCESAPDDEGGDC